MYGPWNDSLKRLGVHEYSHAPSALIMRYLWGFVMRKMGVMNLDVCEKVWVVVLKTRLNST
jgi:hypothetical protein